MEQRSNWTAATVYEAFPGIPEGWREGIDELIKGLYARGWTGWLSEVRKGWGILVVEPSMRMTEEQALYYVDESCRITMLCWKCGARGNASIIDNKCHIYCKQCLPEGAKHVIPRD